MSFANRLENLAAQSDRDRVSRRTFVTRLAKGSVGVACAVAGLGAVPSAYAGNYACCNLCFPSGPWCPDGGVYGSFTCQAGEDRYEWFCEASPGHWWGCGECWSPTNPSCSNASCSYAWAAMP